MGRAKNGKGGRQLKGRGLRILAIASSYMGAIVGAGFASGQEILQFFVQFGPVGIGGIVVAGTLLALLGGCTLIYNYFQGLNSYGDFLESILGKKLGLLVDLWITLLLFVGLVIMLAGSTATLEQQFKLSPGVGLFLAHLVILAAVIAGERGVLLFNTLLMPFLIVMTILVSLLAVGQGSLDLDLPVSPSLAGGSWFLAAILYVSYNMLTGAIFLSSLKIASPQESLGGLLGGVGLGILAALVGLALLFNYHTIATLNIPMLYLAQKAQMCLGYSYALVIWFAMLTTAVANIFSLSKRIIRIYPIPRLWLILVLLFSASLLTPIGFENLIATLYPFFGYLGLLLLSGMFLAYGKYLWRAWASH